MSLLDINNTQSSPGNSTAELTNALAGEIYDYVKDYNSFAEAFDSNGLYDYSNMLKVWNDTEKVVKAVNKYMTGGYVVTPAEYDDEGNVTVEEVRSPTTKTDLKLKMSELDVVVDTDTVVDDMMGSNTITQFKALYESD